MMSKRDICAPIQIYKREIINIFKEKKTSDNKYVYPENEDGFNLTHEDTVLEMEDLLSHFHHLTDLQKKWVVLRFYYGLSNRDIAEIENIALRKVKSLGDLAMKKFINRLMITSLMSSYLRQQF